MNSTNMEGKSTKIEIIGRENIKLSSPTLIHHRSLKICLLDQLGAPAYIPLVIFYPNNDVTTDQRKQKLKDSLSDALKRFYPFAGRIESNNSIECDNNGVPFIEARIHGLLSSFLQHPDMEVLQLFLPIEIESLKAVTTPLLLVQLNFFDCGGLALGLCMSHRFADAASLRTFIKDWAGISLGNVQTLLRAPDFDRAASFFSQRDLGLRLPATDLKRPEIVSKRFVFDARNITALKAKAVSPLVQRPTRTEAVTVLLWRTAMSVRRLNTTATTTDPIQYSLVQFVNVRKRVEPPLPENSIGNLILYFSTISSGRTATWMDEELQDLVARLRKGITDFDENLAKRLGGDHSLELIEEYRKHRAIEERMNVYSCTSWCNFHFYDDADFGWGKPVWMSITANRCSTNYFRLMDTKEGDGVEAWVTLSPQDMALFERDHWLLSFALSNPCVLVG